MSVSERLHARSIQNHDFVVNAFAVQFQLKLEPSVLGKLPRRRLKFAQLDNCPPGTIVLNTF